MPVAAECVRERQRSLTVCEREGEGEKGVILLLSMQQQILFFMNEID